MKIYQLQTADNAIHPIETIFIHDPIWEICCNETLPTELRLAEMEDLSHCSIGNVGQMKLRKKKK